MNEREHRAGAGATQFHAIEAADVAREFGSSPRGLTSVDAARRLSEYGPNRIEEAPPPSRLATLLAQFKSPLIAILLIAAVITLIVDEPVDAAVIAAVLAINAAIGYVQERRAEASVRALMNLVSPHARVLRDGREADLEGADVVPGDVVLVQSGDRVPADLRLFSATELTVDESLLTGESTTVRKTTEVVDAEAPLADRRNLLFSGSVVASGRGRGYVVGTGERTELGRIAAVVREGGRGISPLEQRMKRFAHVVGFAVAAAALGTFALGLTLGCAPGDMFLVAVALAVAAIPEGLPVVMTVALSLGVRRMARRNAIVRRLAAVETLGSTSLIGSDKTGTLTENRMTVQAAWGAPDLPALDTAFDVADVAKSATRVPGADARPGERLFLAALLANEAQIARAAGGFEVLGDPTETALLIAAARAGVDPEAARAAFPSLHEVPFESERRYSASLRRFGGGERLFVKGAPERVLGMCERRADGAPLDPADVRREAESMAARGLRVLAFAEGDVLPERGDPEALSFLGLMGMLDPPRAGVAEAIDDCKRAGIRVLMITGDHASTARAIGRALGIIERDDAPVLTGVDLETLSDDALAARIRDVTIFARVSPEHKLRVVRAAQSVGHVVAVTGDGVNDAPALEHADIGIAMGKSGTDVAREAADMVLADDNFVSIHDAVEVGRVTFDNVRKVTFFLVSTGVGTVILIPLTLVMGLPLPLVPAQLLWLNLVTNGLQDVALAFEPGEADVLDRPPRKRKEPIVSRLLWERAFLCGLVMALVVYWLFVEALDSGRGEVHARTMALTTLVIAMAFHVGTSRSETRSVFRLSPFSNRFLVTAQALALLVHWGALHFAPTQFVLRVEPLSLADWARATLFASAVLAMGELHKLVRGARPVHRSRSARHRGATSAAT